MPTYMTTIQFTPQGIARIGETTKRAADFRAVAKKAGAKITHVFWTLGQFDGALLFEAPDEETATAAMLQLGKLGNVRTNTMRAFTAAEMDGILSRLGG